MNSEGDDYRSTPRSYRGLEPYNETCISISKLEFGTMVLLGRELAFVIRACADRRYIYYHDYLEIHLSSGKIISKRVHGQNTSFGPWIRMSGEIRLYDPKVPEETTPKET